MMVVMDGTPALGAWLATPCGASVTAVGADFNARTGVGSPQDLMKWGLGGGGEGRQGLLF